MSKWLLRAGALLILLGFVLPSLTVSYSYMPEAKQAYSLLDLVGKNTGDQPILLLVPFGALAILILAFIPASARSWPRFLGEVAGAGIGVLAMLIALLSITDQLNSYGLTIKPNFGAIFLVGGYILVVGGLIAELAEITLPGVSLPGGHERFPPSYPAPVPYAPAYSPPPAYPPPEVESEADQTAKSRPKAVIEIVGGSLPRSTLKIPSDTFTIGRSSENDLVISNPEVSRHHASLRRAQGAWFIQDQNSRGGTYVNDQLVSATRLNSGDQITIGDTTFIFRIP
jgi:hypothetical protein